MVRVLVSYSQNPSGNDNSYLFNKKPVIGSPNAAELGKYVDFPIAGYTGTIGISIPVYEIKAKGVSVPISISYHGGGIKVDEVATDIGIGWSLMAGGCINILPNGLIDEISGYPFSNNYNLIKTNEWTQQTFDGGNIDCSVALQYADPYTSDPYTLYTGPNYGFLKDVIQDVSDAEPDMYAFNFLGRSGRFFQDETGVFRTIPYSEIKIERIIANNQPAGYKITDETGNVFEFRMLERNYTNILGNPYSPTIRYSCSYYITKVTTLQGEIVEFSYSPEYNYSYDLQKMFSRATTSPLTSCWQFNSYGNYAYLSETYSTMGVIAHRLDSIRSSDGTLVKFLYAGNDRADLPGTKALQSIEVWDYLFNNKKVAGFTLIQDFSTARLTLKSIQKEGEPPSIFEYSGALPARLSYSQDHYGYYNGRSNSTLLPKDEYNGFWDGADRSVNPDATQQGMLKKIIHPTGGYTEYIYEPNWYYVDKVTRAYPKNADTYLDSRPNTTRTLPFTIPANAEKPKIEFHNTFDGNINVDYCIIHLTGPNNFSRDFTGTGSFSFPSLQAGAYTLSIENVGSTYSADAWIYWFEKTDVPPHNEIGGGVRIKEIRKSDNMSGTVMVKSFAYTETGTARSTGVGAWQPLYLQNTLKLIQPQAGTQCSGVQCSYLEQQSGSITPLTFTGGNHVGYKEISVYSQDFNKNGYSNYKYIAEYTPSNDNIPTFPYAPTILYDWTNGMLLEQTNYAFVNNQYKPVSQQKNYYNYNNPNVSSTHPFSYEVYGAKIAVQEPPFICWSPCAAGITLNTFFSSIYFGIQRYKLWTSWHRLDKTEELQFGTNGVGSIIKTTNFYYDNPGSIQVTRSESTNSKGEVEVIKNKYAKDYASYGFIADLNARNAVALPVERYAIKRKGANNEIVVSGQLQTYKTGLALPDKVFSYETVDPIPVSSFTESSMGTNGVFSMDTRYNEKLSINSYNSLGNVAELQKKNDGPISYIWDYASSKPVAEVVNAGVGSIAYTSFDGDGTGNWTLANGTLKNYGITGSKSYSILNATITKSGLSPTSVYTVSYWSAGGSCAVSGTTASPVQGRTINISGVNWTLYAHTITGVAHVLISGSADIDELRLYPSDAQMTTYTYDPLIGITGMCDARNSISYYEYDAVGRLLRIRDAEKNILKQYDYQYQVVDHGNSIWQETGNTRCKPCSLNSIYLSNVLQKEEKDINTNSSTYLQTRWVDAGASNNCIVQADWNFTGAVRCKTNAQGHNTGQQEGEERDINPCSGTYNNTRWTIVAYNPGACPLICLNCNGIDKKCIDGVCETGVRVCTAYAFDPSSGMFINYYHYEFSDGSWSNDFHEYDNCDCYFINCL